MLKEMSCWHFDWATIGTWVGGLGSAAAACAAVWAVKHGVQRRKNFSKYLLKQDVKRLRIIVDYLFSIAEHLDAMKSDDHEFLKISFEDVKNKFVKTLREMEYFGHEAIQFEYHPVSTEFNNLKKLFSTLDDVLGGLETRLHIVDRDAAVMFVKNQAKQLRAALEGVESLCGERGASLSPFDAV